MYISQSLLNYSGLYGEQQVIEIPEFIHCETLAYRSKSYNWEIKEHLHTNLTQIFILTEGSGLLISEKQTYPLKTPCVVTVPVNTLHGFQFEPGMKGDVLTLSESYLELTMRHQPALLDKVQQLQVLNISQQVGLLEEVGFLLKKIYQELAEDDQSKWALHPVIQLLMIGIYRRSLEDQSTQINSQQHRSLEIFRNFKKLIRQSTGSSQAVQGYAKKIGITSVHLNRICQQIAQKSALRLIHDHLITEAKKYLLNTSYSISEVAYFLNFHDPAHFTKLFKKYVGVTPSEFRKN
jgi:AraC family transcriptional activator of pobA